jgi:poly(A) polymerase
MSRIEGDWIGAVETQAVFDALEGGGHRAFFVGGCVRNALLGTSVTDIDISTDAVPEEVMRLAEGAGLKAVPTGIEHGTVTVVSGHIGFEVTTFRRDVETDGRRAVVAFSTHKLDDARRRDFTMNALYADRQGIVIDPLGQGLTDLAAGRVRFIEDAEARIREDYLRILRFFRFHAWFGHPELGMEAEALAAIAANSAGIDTLSRERIGHEMRRLLSAPDPAPSLAAMSAAGVLLRVLPGADPRAVAPLVHGEKVLAVAPDPIRRLAVLGGTEVAAALKLSREETRRLATLSEAVSSGAEVTELAYRHGAGPAVDVALIRAALAGVLPDGRAIAEAEAGAQARFPLKAADLMPALQGAALGAKLSELEALWIASGFTLDREALIARA